MEYEINTCVLMKLTVVAFSRLQPLNREVLWLLFYAVSTVPIPVLHSLHLKCR